jgi:hypothetical protein
VLHGLVRREPGCEPRTADTDDDTIGGRKKSERVADRLVHGWEHAGRVKHDIDKGRDTDDDQHTCDDGSE